MSQADLSLGELLFVGLNKYVAALDRQTGTIVWQSTRMHTGYVTLLLDGDRLMVSSNGFIYCLDPRTGSVLWENEMKGFGYGVAALASTRGSSSPLPAAQAAAAAQDEAARQGPPAIT